MRPDPVPADMVGSDAIETVTLPKAAVDWLMGEGPDPSGLPFGEFPDDHQKPPGAFWWRIVFRDICLYYTSRIVKAALASPSPPALDGEGREGWQPIETAPKDGTRVLLWANSGYVFSGYWSHDEDEPEEDCWSDDGDNWWEPHHWQPLPAPPKETR